jgi:ABC-type bacteriocin/lantibiotic exporter with double-glycine peptidase domain
MNKLKVIFKNNWKSITLSYCLFAIHSALNIIQPKVLGNTIDHLMAKDYHYAWYLILVFGSMMALGYFGKLYDVRVFSGIYRKFATTETHKQLEAGVETTKINGRLTLMNNVIRFFEFDMIIVIQTLLGVIGSIYFLSLVSWPIVGFMILTGILIVFVSFYFSPKLAGVAKLTNDVSEEQTEIVSSRKVNRINNLLRRSRLLQIKASQIDVKFGFWIQFIVYGSVTALLTYYVMYNKVTVGSVFSTYRYMFDFCNALLGLPNLIISFLNIKDVIRRLENEA